MSALSKEVKAFIVSPAQAEADTPMIPFDVWGTQAHVLMLTEQGILSPSIAEQILGALSQIIQEWQAGSFTIDPEWGAQLSLEKRVRELVGDEAGLSMHTARSRNDQVMLAELLYLREEALEVLDLSRQVIIEYINLSKSHMGTVMPGYTHMQPAKPSTFAHWCLAYAAGLLRGTESVRQVLEQFNQCPLGAVESFGTSWPIKRERVAELLGFERVWQVPQDAISNRGLFQFRLLSAFQQLSLSISRSAIDLLQYSTFEYGYIDFHDEVAQRLHPITGSSVMAQKRNPDALELLRALAPQIAGLTQAVYGLISALPSGYNRDSREVKEYSMLACSKMKTSLRVLKQTLCSLDVNKARMREAVIENYSLTTDLADYLAQKLKLPYRLMYKIVGKVVDSAMAHKRPLHDISATELQSAAKEFKVDFDLSNADLTQVLLPEAALERRNHIGGTSIEQSKKLIENCASALDQLQSWTMAWRERIAEAKMKLSKALNTSKINFS